MPSGTVEEFEYDLSGNIIEQKTINKKNGDTDATVSVVNYFYDNNGKVKSITEYKDKEQKAILNVKRYLYNSMGYVIYESTEDANGNVLICNNYYYDANGNVVRTVDNEKNERQSVYDVFNRVTSETDNLGNVKTYKYNAFGDVVEYVDANGTVFSREYDSNGNMCSEVAVNGTTKEIKKCTYDEGNSLKDVTLNGVTTRYNFVDGKYEPNAYDMLTAMDWSLTKFEMNYTYDTNKRLTNVLMPNGTGVSYEYDSNSHVVKIPEWIDDSISYNKGFINSYTLKNGLKKSYSYNSSLVTNISYESGNVKTGFEYGYDNNLNITYRKLLDTDNADEFSYDDLSRLIKSSENGYFENETWEKVSSKSKTKLSLIDHDVSGLKEAESYYEKLPSQITLDAGARSLVYNFNRVLYVNKVELYPLMSAKVLNRVAEKDVFIYVKKDKGSEWSRVEGYKFKFDKDSQSLHFEFDGFVTAQYLKVHVSWDDMDFEDFEEIGKASKKRATLTNKPSDLVRIWTCDTKLSEEFDYDGCGNRKIYVKNGVKYKVEYVANSNGGNSQRVAYDGKWHYTYDANGNRTGRYAVKKDDGSFDLFAEYWLYIWDLHGRLVCVRQFNKADGESGADVSYEYDGLNLMLRRESHSDDGNWVTEYAYGRNGAVTFKRDVYQDGSVRERSFAYLNDILVGFEDRTFENRTGDGKCKKYYTVCDILGSVTEVWDAECKLVWKNGYSAFGIAGLSDGAVAVGHAGGAAFEFAGTYTGKEVDPETGLTYYWNRWKSEDGSCFISEDPARDGCNWYGYAGGNPIVNYDFTGLSTTRDDFAYQKRTEASCPEEYYEAGIIEAEAAAANQGRSKRSKLKKNCRKNIYIEICFAERNYRCRLDEQDRLENAIVYYRQKYFDYLRFDKDHPLNQLDLDTALGLETDNKNTKSCQTTAMINAYLVQYDQTVFGYQILEALLTEDGQRFKDFLKNDGSPNSLNPLSRSLAKSFGLTTYLKAADVKIPFNKVVNLSNGAILGWAKKTDPYKEDAHFGYIDYKGIIDSMDPTREAAKLYQENTLRILIKTKL